VRPSQKALMLLQLVRHEDGAHRCLKKTEYSPGCCKVSLLVDGIPRSMSSSITHSPVPPDRPVLEGCKLQLLPAERYAAQGGHMHMCHLSHHRTQHHAKDSPLPACRAIRNAYQQLLKPTTACRHCLHWYHHTEVQHGQHKQEREERVDEVACTGVDSKSAILTAQRVCWQQQLMCGSGGLHMPACTL
jgi:hypothetical protein